LTIDELINKLKDAKEYIKLKFIETETQKRINEKRIKDLIEHIPQNFTDLEKARYIYIKLGRYFSYDGKYISSKTEEEKEGIYYKDVDNISDDKIVCSSLSKVYAYILNKVGIKSEIIYVGPEDLKHAYVKIEIGGNIYFTDLVYDLPQIKTGFKTKNFMHTPPHKWYKYENDKYSFSTLTEEELKEIDKKIKYIYHGNYSDDILEFLKTDMLLLNGDSTESVNLRESLGINNLKKIDIIKYKVQFIKKHADLSELYSKEKAHIFSYIFIQCISDKEKELFKFDKVTCRDINGDLRVFVYIVDKNTNESVIFTFSDEDYAIEVDKDYIKEKLDSGMEIISKKKAKKEDFLKLIYTKSLA